MKLNLLLQSIYCVTSANANDNLDIEKIAYHSERVDEQTLFVCIRGYQTDGHEFAHKAVNAGAIALIVEQLIPDIEVPQYVVEDSRKALSHLSDRFLDRPSKSMRVFGVTGTNGKTSITYMTDAIFKAAQLNTGLIGTVMVKTNDKVEPSTLTTPESLDLQNYLFKMKESEVSHVSMEVSSSALDLCRVEDVDFDVVAFTNINKDHIELHGSFEAYYNAKAKLIREAAEYSKAILNIDQPLLEDLVNETAAEVLTFGVKNDRADLTVTDINMNQGRPAFTVQLKTPLKTLGGNLVDPCSFTVKMGIPGYHTIYNALTAIAVGLVNDIPIQLVKEGIEGFDGVERRFHILYEDEFTIIDDLFLNENNIESSMNALQNLPFNAIHNVHAIRGSNGPSLNQGNALIMAEWYKKLGIDRMILTASRSHVKAKDEVSDEELGAFLKVMGEAGVAVKYYDELEDALCTSLDHVKKGDILLITGARGMDYGAKTVLEMLLEKKTLVKREAVIDVLNKKIVGMDDLKLVE
ncbi:Mur ligase family protein [Alkalibacterium pelagium]|uniref:UDP-N-acetylmuramoylalanyl-D-glutamate--2,6-diaminopimelate ligase n=1 Tax=Alkalibacterium pelagium TaxID=426702 RepID=A0A1H7JN84_9LACT|nr:UDP-N-acetylmuramyl-tripeptide synthetase [Alkalibacterium pelagium]GEN50607.1 UDP-N-acetylmuramoyl-L-alanyl-D-glutamate--2,6-diaminopimelate ligase [Alkalibacterium pelagium]SEK75766.1 UDP-N-acetylmuramoylalanyl-D-glutamate--2,6-diaminopimelate ligase [Alkalibacterium pelagium]